MAKCNMKVTMNKIRRNNGGFTMVELLISIAIMLIVSTTIFSFMIYSSKFFSKTSIEADMQNRIRT